MRHCLLSILFFICHVAVYAQNFQNPFDFPILLSGNFGELRSNHFHAGIDFKTQGVEGKPIHAVEEGYVSRVSVSPWGYGNAVYLNHPDGKMTVYGHLQKFNDSIAAYVKRHQYELESFTVNITFSPEQFPVKKGDMIGLAGNSGSSAGPHLHFEVRENEGTELIDPLVFYKEQIKDKKPPRIQGVMVYAFEGRGMVNGKNGKTELKLATSKTGLQTISGRIEAWGDIGLAVKAYDYMDNTTNIYGVKYITLTVDTQVVYKSTIDRYPLSETRYLNSFVDYEEWRDRRSFYMKGFVDPGNRLPFINSLNRGVISIDQEKTYFVTYRLGDEFGNVTELKFEIVGKPQDIKAPDTEGKEFFHWRSENRFGAKGVRLTIPTGNLYDNLYFNYSVKEDMSALAATHRLHPKPVAFHRSAQLSLRLQHDTLDNKYQYGIVQIRNGRPTWIGGKYRQGWLDADIRELGTYSIRQDTKPPVITPVNQDKWISSRTFTFRITDDLSGIESYRGEIDGEYVLFEFDGKKGLISYTFDRERLTKGSHELKMVVTDACGNQTEFIHPFVW